MLLLKWGVFKNFGKSTYQYSDGDSVFAGATSFIGAYLTSGLRNI